MIAESSTADREQGDSSSTRTALWLRVGFVAVALAVSTHAYLLHRGAIERWWIWVAEFVFAAGFLCLAWPGEATLAESALRRWLRHACGVLSIISLAAAIYYGRQLGSELPAGIATFAALIAFLLARWVPISAHDACCLNGGDERKASGRNTQGWSLAAAGIAAAAAAAAVNVANPAAGFALWLVGLVCVAVAAQRFGNDAAPLAPCKWRNQAGAQLTSRDATLALLLILLVAALLRVPLLASYPAFVNSDEGRLGRSALKLFDAGFPNLFAIGWNSFPNISTIADVVPIKILGMGIANLRLASAIFGLASLLVTYFWVRRWWGNVVALLTILILAVNQEHINWSRVGMNNIQQVFVGMLMLATLARALERRRPLDWVWFGYSTGLSFLTYHVAKLFPALLLGVAIIYAIGVRGFVRRNLAGGLIALVAFFVILGPHLVMIYLNWSMFYQNTSNRVDLQVLFDAFNAGDVAGVRSYIGVHVLQTLQLFTINELPFLDPFLAIVAVPSLGWMLWHWRDPRHTAALAWLGGILLIAGMITAYPPNVPRLIGVLPVACLIPAILAGRVRAMCAQVMPARGDYVAGLVLALWLAASAQHNWNIEFVLRPWRDSGDQMSAVCRAVGRTPLPATAYTVGGFNEVDARIAPVDCMMPLDVDRQAISSSDDPAILPLRPSNRGTALFVFAPQQFELLPLMRHYYPRARYDVSITRDNMPNLWMATLSNDEIERNRGLRVIADRGPNIQEPVKGMDIIGCEECATFPVDATASGLVYASASGAYSFRAAGGAVELNDRRVAADEGIDLPAGWHEIEVTTTLATRADRIPVQWKQPGAQEWQNITREYLHTHPVQHGLLGRYFIATLPIDTPKPFQAPPDYREIVPALSFDANPEFDEKPPAGFAAKGATMEWIGTVDLPEGESHTLRLDTTSPATVFINGVEVLASKGGAPIEAKDVTLTGLPRRSQILVRTTRKAADELWFWWTRLLWAQPGGEWTAFADYKPPA